MTQIPHQYNITPAKGQALLNFQGRRFPTKLTVFETERLEEVRNTSVKVQTLSAKKVTSNPNFTNLLLQGDCLAACAYLKQQEIKIDLVYIDPPFASGANYAKKIYLRNGGKMGLEADTNTIGEEVMYGDIWQKEDYLNWLYERLLAIKTVMSETGSIYVHLDWHIGHYVKVLLDEVFGEENFVNEIIWKFTGGTDQTIGFQKKHNSIFLYRKTDPLTFNQQYEPFSKSTVQRFNKEDEKGKYKENKLSNGKITKTYMKEAGKLKSDVWIDNIVDVNIIVSSHHESANYATQKPEALLQRIIKASSDAGMIVADFFSGAGTTAKAAQDLNRKFIACDIGTNAIQTTRDRLVKAKASFDILKLYDGLRLFRNPAQTTAKIFSLIDGFKTPEQLNLPNFWDGGIAQAQGTYAPLKFSGIHDKLTKPLLDLYLEEIYKLEDTTDEADHVIIIYAHKDLEIDQAYLRHLHRTAKTELEVKLIALDNLLSEKRAALFTPDNAQINITKQGDKYKVSIAKFFSPYLKSKIDAYNRQKVRHGTLEQDFSKAVKISSSGLELIEAVQFDTNLGAVWKSNPYLEDKAGLKETVKGVYRLDTNKFKLKIRNIAGDEIIIDSETVKMKQKLI